LIPAGGDQARDQSPEPGIVGPTTEEDVLVTGVGRSFVQRMVE
jgi:hypothetical protein